MMTDTAHAIDYATTRAALTTRQRVLTWDEQREILHPHTAVDDPGWPAPTNQTEARALMRRLPRRARVLCGYIAAEMVLPIWEQWANGRSDVDAGAPRRALELVRRWLDGETVTAQQLSYAYVAAAHAAAIATTAASAASDATTAASLTAAHAASYAASSVSSAARSSAASSDDRREFYTRWWERCRARLAITDVSTSELE